MLTLLIFEVVDVVATLSLVVVIVRILVRR
jgi:hypothetical protein